MGNVERRRRFAEVYVDALDGEAEWEREVDRLDPFSPIRRDAEWRRDLARSWRIDLEETPFAQMILGPPPNNARTAESPARASHAPGTDLVQSSAFTLMSNFWAITDLFIVALCSHAITIIINLFSTMLFFISFLGSHKKGSWLCNHLWLDVPFLLCGPGVVREVCVQILHYIGVSKEGEPPFGMPLWRWFIFMTAVEWTVYSLGLTVVSLQLVQNLTTCKVCEGHA